MIDVDAWAEAQAAPSIQNERSLAARSQTSSQPPCALDQQARLRLAAALLDRPPSQVSSGELPRFAVVRLLLIKPSLIFADEPTLRLDPITQKQTFELLLEAAAVSGTALIIVTHDPHIAGAVSNRVFHIGGGLVGGPANPS